MNGNISKFDSVSSIITGPKAIAEAAPNLLKKGCKKPLLVTDQGVINLEFYQGFLDSLKSAGIDCVIYDTVKPNPPDFQVHEGAEIYNSKNCDSIIALGGGSPMDCAKSIGVIISNGGKIHDYTSNFNLVLKDLPYFIAIPTTAGSGSECTEAAVLTNTQGHHQKMIVWSDKILPSLALVDPEIMKGLPPHLTAATGMDALTHAIEAYLSRGANTYTDALAIGTIKVIFQYLRRAVADGSDLEAREQMAYAQTMAGMAFNNAGLGLVHAMSHPLSATYDIMHGAANALLLPWVMDFNIMSRLDKMIEIAKAAGEHTEGLSPRDAAALAPKAVRALRDDLLIIPTISLAAAQSGHVVHSKDIDQLAEDAMNDIFRPFNPRVATHQLIKEIYTSCWV